jgi:hypothetical protein
MNPKCVYIVIAVESSTIKLEISASLAESGPDGDLESRLELRGRSRLRRDFQRHNVALGGKRVDVSRPGSNLGNKPSIRVAELSFPTMSVFPKTGGLTAD